MQCIKEFTNTSLVQVAQETLETRAHTVCMRKIPYTCLHPRLSASWMPASPPDGSRPPHTHTHSLLLFRFSISCSGEDSLLIHFRGSLVTLPGHSPSPSVGACIYNCMYFYFSFIILQKTRL